MDFNFLFGEHYFENNCSFLGDLIVSFTGAFFGFFLALLSNNSIEKKRIKKKEAEKLIEKFHFLKNLETLINSSLTHINSQTKNFAECAERIKQKPLEIHIPIIVSSDDINRIKNLDKHYIIDSFLSFYPDERNIISDLFIYIDFTERRLKESEMENKRHIDFTYKKQLAVQENIDDISIKISLKLMNLQINLEDKAEKSTEYNYLISLQEIFKELCKKTPIDFNDLKNKYLIYIIETMMNHIADRDFINSTIYIVRRTLNIINNIKENSLKHADDILSIDTEFEKTREKLNLVIEKLNKIAPIYCMPSYLDKPVRAKKQSAT